MRLTSKGRYAVRAMLDLTTHSNGSPVRLQEISNRQNISLHYLEQLFRKLRNGQAVKSVRGPGGGYVSPDQWIKLQLNTYSIMLVRISIQRKILFEVRSLQIL